MTLLEIITATGARVSGGSDYLWNCFGSTSRYLDFVDVVGEEYCSVIFDSKTHDVYAVELTVPGQDQCFKWTNPKFESAYIAECGVRSIDPMQAWDDVKYSAIDEVTALAYAKDIGEMYYDDLPIPEAQV
jgi:hypothetical protein